MSRHHLRAAAVPLAGAVLLTGCAVLSPPTGPEIRQEAGTLEPLGLEEPWRAGATPPGEVEDDWIATFSDDQLSALVAEAVANNADLRVASVRVEQAAAYVRLAQAALRPQVAFFGTGGLNATGGDVNSALQGALLGVSWEPDVWGRLRYARNATRESETSVRADFEFARQSIAANVAKTWFSATLAGLQRRATEAMAAAARELLTLAEQRLEVGVGSEQEVAEARAEQGSLADTALQLRLTQAQTLRSLELLLGRYPAAELAARPELPGLPPAMPAGLPLAMLERRPDMVAAERRVAAAFNRVGEAKAARLPRITLGASVSAISSDIIELKPDHENPSGGLGARLLAPIYQGGGLVTQVEIRTLEQKEAVADYARMALRALGDVERALAALENLEAREALLMRVVTDNERALELATADHRVGTGDLRAVRAREMDLEGSRLALLAVRGARLTERVNLHLALGGSFEEAPPPEAGAEAEAEAATGETAPAEAAESRR